MRRLVIRVEEKIDFGWILKVFEKHNPHVSESGDAFSHFKFDRPEWGISATAYSRGYIPLDEEKFITFNEPSFQGISNSSPLNLEFWNKPETHYFVPTSHYNPDSYDRVFSSSSFGVNDLVKGFPDFFEREKRLVLLKGEEKKPENVKEKIQEIRNSGLNPEDFIFFPINLEGTLSESFYEYFCALHFIEQGFVATFYGSRNTRGAPDLFVYRIPLLQERYGGKFAFELLISPTKSALGEGKEDQRAYSIEAEPTTQRTTQKSGRSGIGQIKKQRYYWPFNGSFSVGPGEKTRSYSDESIGTILFDSEGEKIIETPNEIRKTKEKTIFGFKEYVKFLLLENRFEDFSDLNSLAEYVNQLADLELEDLIA